jgi:glutamate-ammonia-ligase adenylyltransferase
MISGLPSQLRDDATAALLGIHNPRLVAGRIEDIAAAGGGEQLAAILADASLRDALLATISGSRFLSSILCRNPELLSQLYIKRGFDVRKNRRTKQAELQAMTRAAADPPALMKALRSYKEEDYLRIGCRDLAGVAGVQEVMRELSDLAAACIHAALEFHFERLAARHGLAPSVSRGGTGLVVMAMGKLAGGELNFSSDVDLVFLRAPDHGQTTGPEPVPAARFYENLVRRVAASLSEVTEDGFVFRVDLRLRPEGEKGELAPSVVNAVNYYLQWGRTWERAALMRAIPVAGDVSLGMGFLKALEPFIYRKHLDYSTLDDMREMKQRIAAKLKRKPGINIKLGQGGIREIEFFVQALQLINGGKNPGVRSPSTCDSLELFRESGLLSKEQADALMDAYLFFRKTEHRIQINHQVQTHELPRGESDQEDLARRMGYRDNPLQAFLNDLSARRRMVEELFSSLLYSPGEDEVDGCSPRKKAVIDSLHNEEECVALLDEMGFDNPSDSRALLKELLVPGDGLFFSASGRRLLERLAPVFVDELLKTPEPDKALVSLDRYLRSLRGSPGYFSTLLENPSAARFLVRILGESRFFTDLLTRHPQAIDSLIGRWTVQHPREREPLQEELSERLAHSRDYEDEMDVLRIFKNEEIIRIGVSQLNSEINSPTARWLITELAEVCLAAAVEIGLKEMQRRFGALDPAGELPFVILGMGKLGGREMSYLSDVDVIFIYDPKSDQIGRLSGHEWFSRLASRVMSILSVPTGEGTVFQIDARLRPSGQQGPLVSSLSSFRQYHQTTSKLWEKQALIKARPVYGPAGLRDEVASIVRDCVLRTEIGPDDLNEIARLRRRMETELALEDSGHVDLKTGQGGLVDVEFFTQAKQLLHVKQRPQVLRRNTLEALAALRSAGALDEASFHTLDNGYRFLTNLEDRLRIMENRSVDRLPLEGEKLKGLARRLGYPDGREEALLAEYFSVTEAIRGVYRGFL